MPTFFFACSISQQLSPPPRTPHTQVPRTDVGYVGPNLYLAGDGCFTAMHRDGHGTCDSGHTCISGANEVVMLRRLTTQQTLNAIVIALGGPSDENIARAVAILFNLPHERVR